MNAVHLVDRHLPGLEAGAVKVHAKITNHELLVEDFLVGEAASVDGFEPDENQALLLEIVVDGFLRKVMNPIVVALVSQDRSINRVVQHGVFPALVEEIVERFAAGFQVGGGTGGKKRRWGGKWKGEQE